MERGLTPPRVRTTARLGAVGVALAIALVGGSKSSSRPFACAVTPEKQLRARAQLVFDGVALRGPNYRGELLTPARFRVSHYSKGKGPLLVRVQTGLRKLRGGVYSKVSEGVDPHRGELWRIYGRRGPNGVVQTSICSGSRRLARPIASRPATR